jgi:hypothetical protein
MSIVLQIKAKPKSLRQGKQQLFHTVLPHCWRRILLDETTFLQDADGAYVVIDYEGMERTMCHFENECCECGCGDASAPELASDPVSK